MNHPSADASSGSPVLQSSPIILLVDDDLQILQLVARFLRANGFTVHTAREGREMQSVLAEREVDLIILDLMLPGTNGLELCRELRKTSSVPVVMLTAKGEEVDRIIGLEVGADDYLPKPFNPRELLARVNAVLRRTAPSHQPGGRRPRALGFAGWKLDMLKRELTSSAGKSWSISPPESTTCSLPSSRRRSGC